MNVEALIQRLIDAGASAAVAGAVVAEAMMLGAANAIPQRSKRQERNARYYEAKKNGRLNSPEIVLNGLTASETSEQDDTPAPPCLDKENPPAPPKEINPNPPLPPISVGSGKPNDNVVGLFADMDGKDLTPGKRKPANQKPAYSPLFGLVWETFPKHPNASKQQAFTEFQRLSEDDQNLALDGAMAFQEILAETRARNPRYDPPHLSTWLHQRRFDDALEAKPQFRMYKR